MRANFPAGISLDKSAEMAGAIRRILRSYPEVKLVSSQTGRNDSGTDPYGPNRNEIFVALNPYDTWPSGMAKAKLVEELPAAGTKSLARPSAFTQPIIDNVTEAVTGRPPIWPSSSPDRRDQLRQLAHQNARDRAPGSGRGGHRHRAGGRPGAISHPRQPAGGRALRDQRKDVQDVIEMAIGGRAIRRCSRMRAVSTSPYGTCPRRARTQTAIGGILVPTREGGRVPLSQLAEIKVVNGASIIARRENQRQISVRTNIRGRDQGSFVDEAQKLREDVNCLPVTRHWGGQFENLQRARKRLSVILPITIAIIFALLFFAFGSRSMPAS